MGIYCDYHVHSGFSIDSPETMAAMCRAAIQRGLKEICFTEHVDWVPWDPTRDYFKPGDTMAEIERCRAEFAGQLVIRAGIEAGESHLVAQEIAALLAAWPFDFVLSSAHWIDQVEVDLAKFYMSRQPQDIETAYLTRVLELAEAGDLDSLGHLDLIKRYRPVELGPFDPLPYADLIRSILRAIVQRDKAIEINTSPLRKGLPAPCPDLTVLRWYKELGGDKLTLGSDAHFDRDVGAGIDTASELARAAGFERIVTFERHQPRWIPL
jgi:histidinol-phosphatase (PHP family)